MLTQLLCFSTVWVLSLFRLPGEFALMTRPLPRAYFYRNGRELTAHPSNGLPVIGCGIMTGAIGKTVCFNSVTVRTNINDELTERDFGGEPVMVKIWSPESRPVWFAL